MAKQAGTKYLPGVLLKKSIVFCLIKMHLDSKSPVWNGGSIWIDLKDPLCFFLNLKDRIKLMPKKSNTSTGTP